MKRSALLSPYGVEIELSRPFGGNFYAGVLKIRREPGRERTRVLTSEDVTICDIPRLWPEEESSLTVGLLPVATPTGRGSDTVSYYFSGA